MVQYFHSARSFDKYKPYRHRAIFAWWKRGRKQTRALSQQPDLRNPFKVGRGTSGRRLKLVGVFLALLFLVWVGLMLYLPQFKIKSVTYEGQKTIKPSELEAAINPLLTGGWVFPHDNFFLISAKEISRRLQESFSINSARVEKIFPDKIKIVLDEKISSIIYTNAERYVLLDEQGTVIKILRDAAPSEFITDFINSTSTTSTLDTVTTTTIQFIPADRGVKNEFGAFPLLYDERKLPTEMNLKILDKETIDKIIAWQETLDKEGIGVRYFTLAHPLSGLRAVTNHGYALLINLTDDVLGQLERLKILLRSHAPTDHVDLRYGERVFWE